MLSASKGDILVESLELLLEVLIRLIGKALFKTAPDSSPATWGVQQWLWLSVATCIIALVVWVIWRRFKGRHASPNPPFQRTASGGR